MTTSAQAVTLPSRDTDVPPEGGKRNIPPEGGKRNIPPEGGKRNIVPEGGKHNIVPREGRRKDVAGLVRLAREGDREAFGDLVERFWGELVALARGVLAADLEAEDLVQDALVHAWQRLWSLRSPESFPAWMRRIVTRRCLTRARRRRPQQPIETAIEAGEAGAIEAGPLAAAGPEPGHRVDAARLLAALAPKQRAALYLTWIEGCTDQEAGCAMGLRPATVRVHRFRGLKRLRQMTEEKR